VSDLIQRLFGKIRKSADHIHEQAPSVLPMQPHKTPKPLDHPESTRDQTTFNLSQVIVGVGHSIGMQRDHNEDALFTLTTFLVSDLQTIPFGLYIVADGMGGHEHGEEASGVAVRAMAGYVISKLLAPLIQLQPESPDDPIQQVMQDGIQSAHRAIIHHAPGGGTTLTAILILGDQMTIAHVGDSRAYTLHTDKQIQVLTRDHSLVNRLVELGQITSAEAIDHPQRNVLYRALGQGEPVDAEVVSWPLPRSGFILLCSDGLWGVIPDIQITDIIFSSASPSQACQDLVTTANEAGGPDNISVILLQLPA
jgi:PPM family protein phosphatase